MIISLEGLQGAGKSLTAAALVYTDHIKLERKIISTNHLNFPYQRFDTKFFLEHIQDLELYNCDLLLDESYIFLDARTSSGKLNKLFTYFVAQCRKRGVDMYLCIHHIDTLDKRARRAIDVRGTCRYTKEKPCNKCGGSGAGKTVPCGKCQGSGLFIDVTCPECKGAKVITENCERCLGFGETGWATIRFFDKRTGRRTRLTVLGPAYWHLYSTEELVPFTQKQMRISAADI
jgi:hypothetical protein